MEKIAIKIPKVGESIQEAFLAEWYKQDGETVNTGEPVLAFETDKISSEVKAEATGVLKRLIEEGETVAVDTVVGTIEPTGDEQKQETKDEQNRESERQQPKAKEPSGERQPDRQPSAKPQSTSNRQTLTEEVSRKPMSPIRQRIAQRLLQSKQNTAMLTTFNEVDMGRIQEIRTLLKQAFPKKYQVKLGLMPFFVKASIEALKKFPRVNAYLESKDIVYHNYYHIGIAIGGEKGLVVPVVRNADRLNFAEIEKSIQDYVQKIADNKLQLEDLEGGTFTISNGGVYGSLLSTPILNTPQSGILGMHKIEDRPVVINGQIQVRPMMYLAFSYDHRIIDGRESVGFLTRIKECLENPERIMLEI